MSAVLEREQPQLTPRVVRQYSQTERDNALALYDTIGSLEKASQTLGIPMSTIAGWVRDSPIPSKIRSEKSKDLASRFENAAHLYLDLARKKAKKAEFHHLMTGAGIAIDKMQLLRGNPTSITENVERQELIVILQSALSAGAIDVEGQVVERNLTDISDESV